MFIYLVKIFLVHMYNMLLTVQYEQTTFLDIGSIFKYGLSRSKPKAPYDLTIDQNIASLQFRIFIKSL